MKSEAQKEMAELKFRLPSIDSAVEDLSGGQRQGVAVARAAIFARRLVIMDEPTAALGVRESGEVLNLIRTIRDRGLPVLLISHNMPHVFELADRIHIMRLGRRVALTTPKEHSMGEVVAIMTGAMPGNEPASGADAGGLECQCQCQWAIGLPKSSIRSLSGASHRVPESMSVAPFSRNVGTSHHFGPPSTNP